MISMNRKKLIILAVFVFGLFFLSKIAIADLNGINLLKPEVVNDLNNATYNYASGFDEAWVGIVYKGQVVFTGVYKSNDINEIQEWASVTKPATAMIIVRLVREGIISSLDDDVWLYAHGDNPIGNSKNYVNCLPSPYASLTIRNVLTHKTGINVDCGNIWNNSTKKLLVTSPPGGTRFYSTVAYSISGDVMEDATGRTFSSLVTDYIKNPIGAQTISSRNRSPYTGMCGANWQAPSSYISSTILDLAKFTAGVINRVYITDEEMEMMYNEQLGWMKRTSNGNRCLYHTGNNGPANRAVEMVDFDNNIGISVLYTGNDTSIRGPWANELMNVMYSYVDPLQKESRLSAPSGLQVL